jgi:hypothetical protein
VGLRGLFDEVANLGGTLLEPFATVTGASYLRDKLVRDPRMARKQAEADRQALREEISKAEALAIQRAGIKGVLAQRALAKNSLFTGGGDSGGGRQTLGV